ncbi:uncharacterized protein AB675_5153 [Cyphellophora attinorum]|uniref:Bud22 domain-containing protein n=1 Tax=Cyphellophora attinorum TaxID=1664694 RepID=A0A0N1NYS5_9EURO|nr:uncharacterized protein AB675_5153 [Phialophora attinorum]KPI39354.1 hypothetical protein AB675_5153 [Phialophora attinorum]
MSKRKRDDLEADSAPIASYYASTRRRTTVNQQQLSQFRKTLEQSRKSLHAALRLARGFERQKMGRRQKSASKEPQTLLRLREEAIILKQLDLEKTAANHLVKSLSKAKRVRESACFVTVYGAEPHLDGVKSTAEGNVLGRLFGSEPVRKAMAAATSEVYRALGIEDGAGGTAKEGSGTVQSTTKANKEHAMISKRSRVADEELDPMEITTDEEGSEEDGEDDELFDDDSFEGFSDEEDAGNESGAHGSRQSPSISASDSEAVDSNEISVSGSAPSSDSSEESEHYSGSDADSAPSSHPQQPAPRNGHSLKPTPPTTTSTTAFLPSLSMGGYYDPGSDSDSDQEPETIPIERKNRRGQQARRQIAEMKYGKNAKHLQKQTKTKDAGWDARKGAVASSVNTGGRNSGAGPRSSRGAGQGRGRGGSRSKDDHARPGQVTEKPKIRDDTGPVHPSWEAAKARKQQAAVMASGAAAFAGKKITFD